MRLALGVLVSICFTFAASDANAEWILKSNVTRVDAGHPFDVELVLLNDAPVAVDGTLPERLPVRIHGGGRDLIAEMRAVMPPSGSALPVSPGAFRKIAYTLTMPPDVEGAVLVFVTGMQASPLALSAERAATAGTPIVESTPASIDSVRSDTRFEPKLKTHEPIYLVFGHQDGGTIAKFQLSLKYRLLDERQQMNDFLRPLSRMYVGYTQTSFWKLSEESKPVKDTSYKPSVFYFDPDAWTSGDGRYRIALAGGFEHESNGMGRPGSRNLSTLFVRPEWRARIGHRNYVIIAPKLWHFLDTEGNTDINRYRGHFDLNLRVGRVESIQLSTNYRKGSRTTDGLQIDLSYPLRPPLVPDAGTYLLLQYFSGYAEGLLNYNIKSPAQFRLGFGIVL